MLNNQGNWVEIDLKRGEKLIGFSGSAFTDVKNFNCNGFKTLKALIGPTPSLDLKHEEIMKENDSEDELDMGGLFGDDDDY